MAYDFQLLAAHPPEDALPATPVVRRPSRRGRLRRRGMTPAALGLGPLSPMELWDPREARH